MDAVILSIGTELITGQTVDTNSAWLSARLTEFGVRVVEHVTVGDEVGAVAAALGRASGSADLLIATGGLGPTPDDVTRDAIASATSRRLKCHDVALSWIEAYFASRHRDMPPSNRIQAMIPDGCEPISNPNGTAPGIDFATGRTRCFALPGVPAEMKAMFRQTIEPYLRAQCGESRCLIGMLQTFGLSEAALAEKIADLMHRGRNPSVGTTASRSIIGVRIVSMGDTNEEARRRLDADLAELRGRLGSVVFGEGEETLSSAVGKLLRASGKTLAVVESCTGGLLSKLITDTPGSSDYFLRGYVTYSNEAKVSCVGVSEALLKQHGAVSEETARAMAEGGRSVAGVDFALAVTGIAGPGGGLPPEKPVGLACVALADADGTAVRRLFLGETLCREEIRIRSCFAALNMLRLRLLGALHS